MIDKIAFEEYLSGAKGLDSWTIGLYMDYFNLFDFDKFISDKNKYLNKFIGEHNSSPCRAMVRHIINFVKTSEEPNPELLDRCNKAIIERRTGAKPHKEKPILSYTEVEKIANHMPDDWLRMMVLISFNLGLRRSELIKLKVNDINWDNNSVLISGKRNKERTVLMSEEFTNKLANFMAEKDELNKGGYLNQEILFPGYNEREFNKALVKTAKGLGFHKTITTHCLRRSIATYLNSNEDNPMSLEEVRDFLGHSDISTTVTYIIKPKKDAMNKAAAILNNIGKN